MSRCYFFGCWNRPGHFLHDSAGHIDYSNGVFNEAFLDGGLAPKVNPRTDKIDCAREHPKDFHAIFYSWRELPQGKFLRHVLSVGYTAISWWDRCQSDTRPGCSSTFLLEGEHTADEMLAALAEQIPHVMQNLKKTNIELVEVQLGAMP
jgi:hypothetical protein